MIANAAVAELPLRSFAEQLTRVLPSLKRALDLGEQVAGSTPSRSSRAPTLKVTRTVFAPRGARTTRFVAPLRTGRVTSNSRSGTVNVAVHVSRPAAPEFV